MTAINDPLLLQLQYVNESYNLVFWVQQMEHYHARGEQCNDNAIALPLFRMAHACADRALTDMVHYREQLEAQGAEVPRLPADT